MNLKRCIASGAVALAFAAPAAYAQSGFDAADADHNNMVSRYEWNHAAAQHSWQGTPSTQAAAGSSAAGGSVAVPDEIVVVTITPVQAQLMNEQRRESFFRGLDNNGDGTISAAEAGLNTELVNAFARLDRNGDGKIDRQEFARVHVNDGSQRQSQAANASAGQSASPIPSSLIEERSKFSGSVDRSAGSGASAAPHGGGISVQRPPLPSRSIEERSKFSGGVDKPTR